MNNTFNSDNFSKNIIKNKLCKIRVYKDLLTYTNELGIKSGYNGRDGVDGQNGRDGVDGQNGRDGVDGQNGRDGVDGQNGRDGVDGQNGRDGVDGQNGRDGVDGQNGRDGVDGQNGRDGVDGQNGTNYNPFNLYISQTESIESDTHDSFIIPLNGEIKVEDGVYDITIQGNLPSDSTLYLQIDEQMISESYVSTKHNSFVHKRMIITLYKHNDIKLCSTFKGIIENCSVILIRLKDIILNI